MGSREMSPRYGVSSKPTASTWPSRSEPASNRAAPWSTTLASTERRVAAEFSSDRDIGDRSAMLPGWCANQSAERWVGAIRGVTIRRLACVHDPVAYPGNRAAPTSSRYRAGLSRDRTTIGSWTRPSNKPRRAVSMARPCLSPLSRQQIPPVVTSGLMSRSIWPWLRRFVDRLRGPSDKRGGVRPADGTTRLNIVGSLSFGAR